MKRKMIVALLLCCVTLLCACQNTEFTENADIFKIPEFTLPGIENPSESTPVTEAPDNWPNETLAEECLRSLIGSATSEEATNWLSENSKTSAEDMVTSFQGRKVTVTAEYKVHFRDYDIFFFECKDAESGELVTQGYGLFSQDDGKYLLCTNGDEQQALVDAYCCTLCNGTGSTYTDNWVTCGICGGVGTQYYPNAYFDPALNMWMGQTMACSGCGGAGRFNQGNALLCSQCQGEGLVFP